MRCEVSDADVKGDVSSVELINDQFCVIILSGGGRAKGCHAVCQPDLGREPAGPKEAKYTAMSLDVFGPSPKFGSKMACCSGGAYLSCRGSTRKSRQNRCAP